MKQFVLLSDLHAHPWSAFATGDGLRNSRLRTALDILDASLERAHELDVPWVFAGDLVHTAGSTLNTVLAGVTQVLGQWPNVPKIVVWGNHDARGRGGKITADQTMFAALAYAIPMTILDPSIIGGAEIESGGITFAGAGYQPRIDLLDKVSSTEVGIYHQTVRGSTAPNGFVLEEGLDPQVIIARHRLSIVGHVHHPQQIGAPAGQGILIPGAPEHHNFGDHGDRGWWVITLPDIGNPELEFVSAGSPQFLTVETPADVQANGNFYRIRNMPAGTVLPDGVVAVAPTPTTIKHRDTLRGVSETEQILQIWLTTQPPAEGVDKQAYLAAGRELLVTQDPRQLRDVRVTELCLHNFCCFEDQDITIQRGLWLITGRGRDYPSNGAGKSSLIGEALYWLLFGRTTKGLSADEVIRWGATECRVWAAFEHDSVGPTLIVTRRRGPEGHTLTVEQDGHEWEATSVNEMTTKLGHYLGITPEIFQNLAYFSQEKLLLFSSATDGERKNVLADLIGLQAYQDASSSAGAQMAAHTSDRLEWATRSEMLERQLEQLEETVLDGKVRADQWETSQTVALTRVRDELGKLRQANAVLDKQEASTFDALETEVNALVKQYAKDLGGRRTAITATIRAELLLEHTAKLEGLEAHLVTTRAIAATGFPSLSAAARAVRNLPQQQERLTKQEALHAADSQARLAVQEEKVRAESSVVHAKRQLDATAAQLVQAHTTLAEGVCPTCQQKVTKAHQEKCLAPVRERHAEAAVEHKQYQTTVTALRTLHMDAENKQATSAAALQDLRTLLARLNRTDQQLREVSHLQVGLDDIRDAAVPERLLAERVDAQLALDLSDFKQHAQQRVDTARQNLGTLIRERAQAVVHCEEEIARLGLEQNPHTAAMQVATNTVEATRQEHRDAQHSLDGAQALIEMYDYWRKGFSKQGLQSLLVEEVAARFNSSRADIFPLLTQGIYDVQFSTLSKTRAGELREKTEFVVYEHGKPILYNALSGGQRRRIDIGIMLVLTQAVAQWMGVHGVLGLLILDEVFSFLDDSGAEGLIAALGQITEQVPTIYVITHDTHLQSMIPAVIQVVQDEKGISKVV